MFVPVADRILILRASPDKETQGSIVIPDKAQEAKEWGRVVAIGATVTEVSVGDDAYFGAFAGTTVKLDFDLGYDPGDYVVVQEQDILGVLKPDPHESHCLF